MIEMVVALVVGAILLGIALQAFGGLQQRMSTGQAMRTFQGLHARARAQAIETGSLARLWVDVAGDSVTLRRSGNVLETVRFRSELGVDLRGTSFILCMGPQGYANPDCNSFSSPVTLAFVVGGESESVQLLPMGQLVLP